MRCVRRNDHDAARFYLALFISDRDGAAALSLTRDRPITHRFPSGFAIYPPAFPPHGVFTSSYDIPTNGSCSRLMKLMAEIYEKVCELSA